MHFCQQGCALCGKWRDATYRNALYVQLSDDKSWIVANLCWDCFAKNDHDLDVIRKNLSDSEKFCSPCGTMSTRLGRIRFIDAFKYGSDKHKVFRQKLGLDHG